MREHKTGVHYFHEYVTRDIVESKPDYDIRVAYFEKGDEHSKYLNNPENTWIDKIKCVCNKPRIFSYCLPIENFFGRNDLYFCDGLFPITKYHSKKVCLVHDLMVKIYPQNYSLIKKIYLEWFFKKLPRADAVVCVSENTKNDVIKYYHVDPKKITVCYNGVDDHSITYPEHPENLKINEEDKFFLYIGDMRKNKNLKNTIRGFLDFCDKNPKSTTKFYLAGKQNDEYLQVLDIVNNSRYKDRIKFLGYISGHDRDYLYAHTEAVILLSAYEGFGMPIIEGMQRMKPVITSNCSSMKEVGEGAAILADPFDINEISGAMTKVDTGDYTIDKSAYQEKLRKYSFENVAGIINGVISGLL